MSLREQLEGSASDLQAAARNAVSPQNWLRTAVNVAVVGLVFVGLLKLLKRFSATRRLASKVL